jgi:hypothetical protein
MDLGIISRRYWRCNSAFLLDEDEEEDDACCMGDWKGYPMS